jgi:RES domain
MTLRAACSGRPNPCKSWVRPDARSGSTRTFISVIVFRVCDARFPFLWTASTGVRQQPARWHGPGEGPVQYFSDTPPGAWAELLRHEEITDPADLAGISTRLWAVRIGDLEMHEPKLSTAALTSAPDGYEICRAEARRLRAAGAVRLVTVSAALKSGEGAGFHVGTTGLLRTAARDGNVIVHFGALPDAEGWSAAEAARPDAESLTQTRPLHAP